MQSLILITVVLTICGQNLANKFYSQSGRKQNVYIHSGICCLTAMLLFLAISAGSMDFSAAVLPYSFAFATAFGGAILFGTLAMKNGPLSLTSLFVAYAQLIPAAAGVALWNEKITLCLILGGLCFILSLFLIYFKPAEKTITIKWLIFAVLSFLFNGMCSVIQRLQQTDFDNMYSSFFMIAALFTASIILLVIGMAAGAKTAGEAFKRNWYYGVIYGVLNGLTNYGVIKLNEAKFPASIMFPIISAGSIILTFACSFVLFREKLSKMQLLGAGVGIAAIVLFCV